MRDSLRVGGVLLILWALPLMARSWHETGRAAPAPVRPARPTTKVALINLSYVLKNYQKVKTFEKELKTATLPYQAKHTAYMIEGEKLEAKAKNPKTTAVHRQQIENRIEELKKLIEDNKTAANAELEKKRYEQKKTLYKDVEAASRRYAIANDIELVLQYNDFSTEYEWEVERNFYRKMHADALVPLFMAPGIDVSKEIVAALNTALRRKKGG